MTPDELQDLMKKLHMAKVRHAEGYLEQHSIDAAVAALLQIEERMVKISRRIEKGGAA